MITTTTSSSIRVKPLSPSARSSRSFWSLLSMGASWLGRLAPAKPAQVWWCLSYGIGAAGTDLSTLHKQFTARRSQSGNDAELDRYGVSAAGPRQGRAAPADERMAEWASCS